MQKKYIELITTENTKVYVKKSSIDVVEEVPGTARSQGYTRMYISGYRFSIKDKTPQELIEETLNSADIE